MQPVANRPKIVLAETEINALGPMMVTRGLVELLKLGTIQLS